MVAAIAATNTTAAKAISAAGSAVASGAAAMCGLRGCSVGVRGARTSLTGDCRRAATALWTPLSIALEDGRLSSILCSVEDIFFFFFFHHDTS